MTTKIPNVRVFTGTSFSEPSDVFVADTKILSILPTSAKSAHEADTPGISHFLIPGLIDAHVHIATQTSLLPAARHGITTALDMALFPDPPRALAALRAASPYLTDIRSAGIPATAPGTMHSRMPSMPAEALLETVEQAKAFVAKRIEEKVDYVKVVADVPVGPSQEVLDAVVGEAHKAGKLVVAHAARMGAFEMAIRSGADVLTHVPLDGVVTGEMAEDMRERGMVCCPTLVMMRGMSGIVPRAEYRFSRESVGVLKEAGVVILAGTDANDSEMCPVPLGSGIHEELALLIEAGLSSKEALWAVTEGPTKVFGLEDRGKIEVGLRADLVLLGSSPLDDIASSKDILGVWCAGHAVDLT
jgi:imidazolonepropionase-like amidohydrolase